MPKVAITIVVPVIDLWTKYTKPCLDSIKTSYNYEVILIDNGSTDQTQEEASKYPNLTYIRNETNVGVAPAWNQGIKLGLEHGAETILISNNDILFHGGTIDSMVDVFHDLREFIRGGLAISALNVRERLNNNSELLKSFVPTIKLHKLGCDWSCFMLDQETIDTVGWFDEGFAPAYWEDVDYTRRMTLLGGEQYVLEAAPVYHHGSRTQYEVLTNPSDAVHSVRTLWYYKNKWGGPYGEEKFVTPFGVAERSLKWTKQDEQCNSPENN